MSTPTPSLNAEAYEVRPIFQLYVAVFGSEYLNSRVLACTTSCGGIGEENGADGLEKLH